MRSDDDVSATTAHQTFASRLTERFQRLSEGDIAELPELFVDLIAARSHDPDLDVDAMLEVLLDTLESGLDSSQRIAVSRSILERVGKLGRADARFVVVEIERLAAHFSDIEDHATAAQLLKLAVALYRDAEGPDVAGLPQLYELQADELGKLDDAAGEQQAREEAAALRKLRQQASSPREGGLVLERGGATAEGAARAAAAEARAKAIDAETAPAVREVDVYFATHRLASKQTNPYRWFGGNYNRAMTFGIAKVGVPKDRNTLAVPPLLDRYGGLVSDKFFTLNDVVPFGNQRTEWLSAVRKATGSDGAPTVLLYIHGFWSSFWRAMLRAAHIGLSLEIRGAIAAYSWPSSGILPRYGGDRAILDSIAQDLGALLGQLAAPMPVAGRMVRPSVLIVAHSMGCDALVRGLDELRQLGEIGGKESPPIKHIVYASPDVELNFFRQRLERLRSMSEAVTTYVSERDLALWLSSGLQHPRAGRLAEKLVSPSLDIECIDTTGSKDGFFGHEDYASVALQDVKAAMIGRLPAIRRPGLAPAALPGGQYWILKPPSGASVAGVTSML